MYMSYLGLLQTGGKKYFKQADLAAKRQQEYFAKHEKRAKLDGEEAGHTSSGSTVTDNSKANSSAAEDLPDSSTPKLMLSRKEVKDKFVCTEDTME